MQHFNIPSYEYISDFFVLNKNIFVFDDLERCTCPPNDILGYINGLVEHEGAKVILIANEQEIGTLTEAKNKELQYLVSSNINIKIPQEESMFSFRQTNADQSDLNIDELERRRKKLFSDIEYNQQYIKIREKLIGQTFQYESNFSTIMHKLICFCSSNNKLKQQLESNVKYFIEIMTEYKHGNLRTFQFFLSKIDYLHQQFLEFKIDMAYQDSVSNFIIQNCFMLCVEFKGIVEEPEEQFQKIIFQNKRRMPSIKNYVEYSIFDTENYLADINVYINTELSNCLPDCDPYSLLYSEYYLQTQEWVEEKINLVLEKLKKNEYKSSLYSKMLIIFIRLVNYGFPEKILLQAEEYMIANVQNGNTDILDDYITSNNSEEISKCKEIVGKINYTIRSGRKYSRQDAILKILESTDSWAENLNIYWDENKQHIPHEEQILSYMDADSWWVKILSCTAKNINFFRIFLDGLYPVNVTKANVDDDMFVSSNRWHFFCFSF